MTVCMAVCAVFCMAVCTGTFGTAGGVGVRACNMGGVGAEMRACTMGGVGVEACKREG